MSPIREILYMILAVDGNEANVTEKVGVSIYTLKLLENWQKIADPNLRIIVFLKKKPGFGLPAKTDYFDYQLIQGDFLWSQTFLPLDLYRRKALGQKIDLFFSPAHYTPRFSPIPTVVTIHDLSYLYYPQEFLKKDLYKLKNWTQYSLTKSQKIIAVSQNSKKDIVRFYKIPEEKIEVIYNGFEKPEKIDTLSQKQKISYGKSLKKPYILSVGTLQPRKNFNLLIEAFSHFLKKYPKFKLILAGKKGWLFENIFKQIKDLSLENKVELRGYVTDSELISLYQNAFFFVLPSLYEGFGIPVLEAMNYKTPVIASSSSSLPEVGGNACLYFKPDDSQQLLKKMLILANDKKLRSNLILKGNARVKLFSWKKCSQETLKLLVSQAASNR